MMRHPMHLHGFDFRVLNEQGENAPMKTSSILCQWKPIPLSFCQYRGRLVFPLSYPVSYDGGMNRVFAVDDYKNPELPNKAKAYKNCKEKAICHLWHRTILQPMV
jgi:FtsP/CotA-like multicopper oxidase with cupredoxin domain